MKEPLGLHQILGAFVRRAPTSEDREHFKAVLTACRAGRFAEAVERLRWVERDYMSRAALAAECRAAVLELQGGEK